MRPSVLLLFAGSLAAQSTILLPAPPPLAANTNLPFSAGVGRYQQWFSQFETTQIATEPVRIDQIEILAGTAAATTTTLDLQVAMAHASAAGLGSLFDNNFLTPPVTVVPRRIVTITGAPAGGTVLTLPFQNMFTWDGQSALVVEVRVFGNGLGNQPFNFDLRGTSQGFGLISRVYQGNNTSATSGVVSANQGLFMRFRFRFGASLHFGQGCRGVNQTTPIGTTLNLPQPGGVWQHRLDNAAAQRFCVLVIGTSRTQWVTGSGTVALPFDMGAINGGFGCPLLTNPEILTLAVTVGSPGAASANVNIPIAPLPTFAGLYGYSQWMVDDPASDNGVMSATDGIWSIVTPVGG